MSDADWINLMAAGVRSIDPTTIDKGGRDVSFEVIDVTPAMAKKWLGRWSPSRDLSDEVVKEYARDMAAGEWRPENAGPGIYGPAGNEVKGIDLRGGGVVIDEDGYVVNGGHRLHALIASGVESIPMTVCRGAPRIIRDLTATARAMTAFSPAVTEAVNAANRRRRR